MIVHAVTISGGDLLWDERPDPVPGDTEVLVRVQAAGLNGADMLQRAGLYPAPPGAPPDIPGLELAGEVVSCGRRVSSLSPGARVAAIVPGGAQAELACVEEATLMPLPDAVAWPAAGGFPEVFSTAYDALFRQCALGLGERVLVTGAAGGVGTAALQLAAAAGARVTASARRAPEHESALVALGAVAVVEPEDDAAIGEGGPYDVVLELVGAPSLERLLPHLATVARVSVIGVSAGAQARVNLLALMGARASIRGSTLRSRPLAEKAILAAEVASRVLPLLADGTLRVPVAATYPMEEAAAAYERFAAGGKLGKIVLSGPAH